MVFSIPLLTLALGAVAPPRDPKWLDRSVATYALRSDRGHNSLAVFDPIKKYFLMRDIECDGAIVSLILTDDPTQIRNEGYVIPGEKPRHGYGEMKVRIKTISTLSTGKGVKIGDSTTAVLRRLGKPTKRSVDDGEVVYDYTLRWGPPDSDSSIDEMYTFWHGKLREISFLSDRGE